MLTCICSRAFPFVLATKCSSNSLSLSSLSSLSLSPSSSNAGACEVLDESVKERGGSFVSETVVATVWLDFAD